MVLKAVPTRASWFSKYQPRAGDGCVLWLPGQDDAQSITIRDRSGLSNNGTISGATWRRTERGVWVLSFNGVNQFVQIAAGAGSSLDITSTITVMCWAYLRAYSDTYGFYIGRGTSYDYYMYQDAIAAGSKIYALILPVNTAVAVTPAATPLLTWIFLAFTYDSGLGANALKTYYNGTLLDQGGVGQAIGSSANPLVLGGDVADRRLNGDLCLWRVSNIVWSASQLAETYRLERSLFGV